MASTITASIKQNTGLRRTFLFLILLISFASRAQLSGTYTVGNGAQNYPGLTTATGIFQAINTLGINGNVVIRIATNLPAETGAVALNQWASPYTVTIIPHTNGVKTITYSGGCAGDLINLNGTDNLTIDGRFNATGTGRNLQFVSGCAGESVIQATGDCVDLTIRNCILSSDNTSSQTTNGGALRIDQNQLVSGCDNLRILFNLIEDNAGTINLCDGIQINAPNTAGVVLTGLDILNNELRNVNGRGIYMVTRNGAINGSQVIRNSLYVTGTITGSGVPYSAIQLESGSGHTIRANWLGGNAPQCTGGMLLTQLTGTSADIALIRLKAELPNATVNTIDSNVIKNLQLYGSTTLPMSVSFIQVEHGNCTIGSNFPNYIGDATVDARWTGTPSVLVSERFNSLLNTFNAIYSTSNGTVSITNNRVGGLLFPYNTNNGFATALFCSNGSSASMTNNVIGGVAYNVVKESPGTYRVFYSLSDNSPVTISGNSVFGLNGGVAFFDNLDVIRVTSGSGAPTISNNTIETINMTLLNCVFMIRVSNPGALIDRNTMRNVTITSQTGATVFYGIHLTETGGSATIRDNRLSNINATNTATVQTNLVGLYATGAASFTFDSNFIEKLSVSSANTNSYTRGIHITTATLNHLRNNVVLLNNNALTNDIFVYALYDDAVSGTNQVYFNTFDVRGTMAGNRSSACYFRDGNATRSIRNNIFNNRRTGGTGGHYAFYNNVTTGSLTSNYNVLYAEENAGNLVRYGGNLNFAGWQGLGFDALGLLPLTSQNIVDFVTGKQTTTVGNDRATDLGISVDHIDVARPVGLGFDIGAFEIDNILLLSPLPVLLSNSELICEEGKTTVRWSTVSEIENDYFYVEKSADAVNWEPVTGVPGQGSSFLMHHYEVHDSEVHRDGMYYRIVQVDVNGTPTYFDAEFINCSALACEDFRVQYTAGSELKIIPVCEMHDLACTVYSASGQLVCHSEAVSGEKEISRFIRLSAGVYVIRLSGSGRTYTKRIVI